MLFPKQTENLDYPPLPEPHRPERVSTAFSSSGCVSPAKLLLNRRSWERRRVSPLPRNQFVYPDSYRSYGNRPAPTRVGGTTGFVGDWWRTEDRRSVALSMLFYFGKMLSDPLGLFQILDLLD